MFHNRQDAGRRLASRLRRRDLRNPLVLAIPRGGVVVGFMLARELGAELDVVLSRKLRAPAQQEYAMGAISEDGHVYLNPDIPFPGPFDDYVEHEKRVQLAEIARRKEVFRAVRPQATVEGRSVIVTDDGIATGATMIAALQIVKAQRPPEVIVAVPVSPPDRLEEVRRWCDDAVCLYTPEVFWAIGQFYADFSQVDDAEVLDLLRLSRTEARTEAASLP